MEAAASGCVCPLFFERGCQRSPQGAHLLLEAFRLRQSRMVECPDDVMRMLCRLGKAKLNQFRA